MLEENRINYFGETNFRNRKVKFGIKTDDRRRHMYVIGKTGMGKSTLLENMIIEDIQAGAGLAVTDPHGDMAEKILSYVPSSRINDVIYFNPFDAEYPIAFNILENNKPEYKNLIASGLVGVFKKIWADSWGPRLEYILMNAILALLENPGNTLLGLPRLLVDKKFRKKIVDHVDDPVVKSFWVDEYANYNDKFRNEAIAPIQNKIGQFLSSALIRNIVAQPKSTIDVRRVMDEGKILIMNLSKGRVGEENSALLGAMMITRIQLAAMSRVDIPESERRDFFLYVDEFQNFSTESFAQILAEARKYRLSLVLAHQYIEQLSDVVKAAVFGNVGTMITFRVGAVDAEEFEKEYDPHFLMQDLVNLPKYHFYLKLMIDGVSSEPFSAASIKPESSKENNVDTIIRVSRERYGRPIAEVEEKIKRWAGVAGEHQQEEREEKKKINLSKVRPGDNLVLSGLPKYAKKVDKGNTVNTPQTKQPKLSQAPHAQTSVQKTAQGQSVSPQQTVPVTTSSSQTATGDLQHRRLTPQNSINFIQQQEEAEKQETPKQPAANVQYPPKTVVSDQTPTEQALQGNVTKIENSAFNDMKKTPQVKKVQIHTESKKEIPHEEKNNQYRNAPQQEKIQQPTGISARQVLEAQKPVQQPQQKPVAPTPSKEPAYVEVSQKNVPEQEVSEDQVQLQKVEKYIDTGPMMSLGDLKNKTVMNFSGRPKRPQRKDENRIKKK